jgi:predicted deacylase
MPTTVTRRTLDLAGLEVPVVELAGAQDGPLLTVIAGVHGCEYVPMAAVREWTRDLEQREISGRIRAVPVLNVTAFRARSPFVVPEDGKNLNRCFPGDPDGTLAQRLAYAAFTQLITGSDAYIDAHCGDMVEALEPFALYEAGPAEAAARELALAYGLGYIIRQEPGPDRAVSGTSSGAAAQAGIPAITAEAGGCGLVERPAVDAHLRGLNAVLAHLGMTGPAESGPAGSAPARPEPALLGRFLWLRCARAGWWAPTVAAGDQVSEGQVVGTVSSLDGSGPQETITAPADGVIIFLTSSPAVADDGLLLGLGAR